ncbi:MAG: HAD-IIIA family hydrolase [candidate division Zixibacteria bacterium]|nr:HAD-IIIA family hydrolase [candidate division Zixibacteria bacterium]NIR66433.1 HAD-IIIA family hydrolase [candidate division Zixibacteria bacterium]NIS18077.1 HAD-IIIA family hydrolase [candidate division Zixibacteria bacterium]NIS48023.1 HAD-IIIA family hydrolase [candidate division Zixibacteria bacterium]NIT54357.1 HAD-IIIA family hydrolase [candidate division Zixibacteria bacterium]
MKKPVVFLDRDGTLIEEVNFLLNEKQIKVWPKAIKAMRLLRSKGFLLIILSNQSGVARGYLTEERVEDLNRAVFSQMRIMGEVPDAFYFCPFHPEAKLEQYRRESDLRKPGVGMARLAAQKFDIDLGNCYSVGDKLSDVGLGQNLGGKGVLVLTGYGKTEKSKLGSETEHFPDCIASDILEAAEWIVNDFEARKAP